MYTRKIFERNLFQATCTAFITMVIIVSIAGIIYSLFFQRQANSPEHVITTGTEEIREEYIAMYNSGSLLHTIPDKDAKILEAYGLTFIHTVDLLNHTYEGSNGYFMYVVNLEDNTCVVLKNKDGSDMTVNQWFDQMLIIWNS